MPTDKPLCPATRRAIESLAHRLRILRCDNSLVAMHLHRVARDLEAIADRHATLERCGCRDCATGMPVAAGRVAAPIIWSAQDCGE